MKLDIKFKVTASKKNNCIICCKNLFGEEGFIEIISYSHLYYVEKRTPQICMECWKEKLEEIETDRKKRKKRYKYLLKRQILRKIK